METVKQEATPNTAGEQQPERTFTQAEVNAIVADRLSRERSKYADYDELKARASELQQANARADALQGQLDSLNKATALQAMRGRVSTQTGVPAELLTGETEEECTAQANKIKRFAEPSYPVVRNGEPYHAPSVPDVAAKAFSPNRKHKPKEFRSY